MYRFLAIGYYRPVYIFVNVAGFSGMGSARPKVAKPWFLAFGFSYVCFVHNVFTCFYLTSLSS